MPCKALGEYYKRLDWSKPNQLILEIGSDRDEGSTQDLAAIAREVDAKFITVDVSDYAQKTINDPTIEFVVCDSGSNWCRDIFSRLTYRIKILYLDNFDWIWDEREIPPWIQNQIVEYRKRGVTMNNVNCVQEHFAQFLYCYPRLEKECLVVVDDTWLDPQHGVYIGKCGMIVHYLLHFGFKILYQKDCGMILGRGIE